MPPLKTIKNRIISIEKIKKIANAMEIVALTRLRKIERRTQDARPYFDMIRDLINDLAKNLVYEAHPFLKERKQIKKTAVILIASDKGLCGNFNTNITNTFKEFLDEHPNEDIIGISIGKNSESIFKKNKIDIKSSSLSSLKAQDYITTAAKIVDMVSEMYLAREIDQLSIVFNKFKLQFLGKANIIRLLPLRLEGFKIRRVRDYIYEPSAYFVWEQLLKEYLVNQTGQSILESSASEEMARMLAMKQARDNADDVIYRMNLNYHKARQANITRELIEIITASGV